MKAIEMDQVWRNYGPGRDVLRGVNFSLEPGEVADRIEPAAPLSAPASLTSPERWPKPEKLKSLDLLPSIPWHKGIETSWDLSERGAGDAIERFVHEALHDYDTDRDRHDTDPAHRAH